MVKESKPLVSTVTLTYQKFEHLFETLNSILSQDYPKIEIIIADDNSDIFPLEEIRKYIDINKRNNIVRTLIIQQPCNVGTVKNINSAIKTSQGEYVIGIGSDDAFFESSSISKIVDRFEKTGWEMISFRRLRCTEKEMCPIRYMPPNAYLKKIASLDTPEKQFAAFALGRFYEMASGSATFYRRSYLKRYGSYNESYMLWEDGPSFLNYTRDGNFIHTAYDIVSTKYREGGISTSKNKETKAGIMLRQDTLTFYREGIFPHLSRFKRYQVRYLRGSYELTRAFLKQITKLRFFISYPDVFLYKCFKRIRLCYLERKSRICNME